MLSNLTNTQLVKSVKNVVVNTKRLPGGVHVFMFGSACYRISPNDIDMLFVYDASLVPPCTAYSVFKPLMTDIEYSVGIPIHSLVLSQDEVRKTGFIGKVEPIELRST